MDHRNDVSRRRRQDAAWISDDVDVQVVAKVDTPRYTLKVVLRRSSAEGGLAARELRHGRPLKSVTSVVRTLPGKIVLGLITSLTVSALSSLAVVLIK